jgi:hypothetical protein
MVLLVLGAKAAASSDMVQDITSWQPKAKEQLRQGVHFLPEACK